MFLFFIRGRWKGRGQQNAVCFVLPEIQSSKGPQKALYATSQFHGPLFLNTSLDLYLIYLRVLFFGGGWRLEAMAYGIHVNNPVVFPN